MYLYHVCIHIIDFRKLFKTFLKALTITFELTHIPNVPNVPVRIPALIQLQHKI